MSKFKWTPTDCANFKRGFSRIIKMASARKKRMTRALWTKNRSVREMTFRVNSRCRSATLIWIFHSSLVTVIYQKYSLILSPRPQECLQPMVLIQICSSKIHLSKINNRRSSRTWPSFSSSRERKKNWPSKQVTCRGQMPEFSKMIYIRTILMKKRRMETMTLRFKKWKQSSTRSLLTLTKTAWMETRRMLSWGSYSKVIRALRTPATSKEVYPRSSSKP